MPSGFLWTETAWNAVYSPGVYNLRPTRLLIREEVHGRRVKPCRVVGWASNYMPSQITQIGFPPGQKAGHLENSWKIP